jgi:hypothetical protein
MLGSRKLMIACLHFMDYSGVFDRNAKGKRIMQTQFFDSYPYRTLEPDLQALALGSPTPQRK